MGKETTESQILNYAQDIDEQAYAQGRNSSHKDAKTDEEYHKEEAFWAMNNQTDMNGEQDDQV
jgi:hypothetical protein